jgi:hypothetical protein
MTATAEQPRKQTDWKFIIGCIFMVIAYLGFTTFWLMLFALPFYLIAVVLIALSRKSKTVKILTTVLPLIFNVSTYILFSDSLMKLLNW